MSTSSSVTSSGRPQEQSSNIDRSSTRAQAFRFFQKSSRAPFKLQLLPKDILCQIASFRGKRLPVAMCKHIEQSQKNYANEELTTLVFLKNQELIEYAFPNDAIEHIPQYRFLIMHRQLYQQLLDMYDPGFTKKLFEKNGQLHINPRLSQVIYCHEFYLRLHECAKPENYALLKVWNNISNMLRSDPIRYTASLPFAPQEIRAWMHNPKHRSILQQITNLNLSNLSLRTLPPELDLLTGLTQLDLSDNQLSQLPDNFGNSWVNLQQLDLHDNQLNQLPDDFGNSWVNLQRLDLYNNQLNQLPDDFGKSWVHLWSLYLDKNQLGQLPNNFGKSWIDLLNLRLNNNQLNQLTDNFGNSWVNLLTLFLQNNQLNQLPPNFGNFWADLRLLWFSNNQLNQLSGNFGNSWINLKSFRFQNNQLNQLPDHFGDSWVHLEELWLQNNQLNALPDTILNRPNLQLIWDHPAN